MPTAPRTVGDLRSLLPSTVLSPNFNSHCGHCTPVRGCWELGDEGRHRREQRASCLLPTPHQQMLAVPSQGPACFPPPAALSRAPSPPGLSCVGCRAVMATLEQRQAEPGHLFQTPVSFLTMWGEFPPLEIIVPTLLCVQRVGAKRGTWVHSRVSSTLDFSPGHDHRVVRWSLSPHPPHWTSALGSESAGDSLPHPCMLAHSPSLSL